jgi:pimeloyl-ACP methyl ester carboxylesterase/DNA-binding CsgD family transcriptional regulator
MSGQQIRFCTSDDGTSIAYSVAGKGPALVRAPHWMTHLEYDRSSPIRRHWFTELSRSYTLVTFDMRGCGLSDRDPGDISFESWIKDLEAVVDAAEIKQFALYGSSQGGAIAIDYATRHPERVSHLVLLGAFARGKLKRDVTPDDAETQIKLIELGWGSADPTYRRVFAGLIVPSGSLEELESLCKMMQMSTTPANALRIVRTFFSIDVSDLLSRLQCPTLVMHARGDLRVPFEQGRLLARMIPGARFVPLDTPNHLLLEHDPAWSQFVTELRDFFPPIAMRSGSAFRDLSAREVQVLAQLANGLENAQIAANLGVAEKTVRNHLSHIFDKLNVQHRGQAIVRAREAGFGSS